MTFAIISMVSLGMIGIFTSVRMVILAVITIAFGILIFANPFATQALLVRVFACGLIYNGVVKLILSVI